MAESNLPTTGEELEVKNEFPATVSATEKSQVTSSDAELDVYDDPLRGIAKECLEKGNKEYRQGEANNAIISYTEGLQVNCRDKSLNAKLYSNRAAAHFRLANYVECVDDATVAVQLEPTLIQAIEKGARACVELSWDKEARSWLHMGLTIENNNERLLQLLRKSNAELKVKAHTYASLGCAYCHVGQFHTAIKYHQQDLEIAEEVGDKKYPKNWETRLERRAHSVLLEAVLSA
nr:tetratricopeptide repeat protein 4-like [Pocillopora verrucosa]